MRTIEITLRSSVQSDKMDKDANSPKKKRFKVMTNAELKQKQQDLQNTNTKKSEKRADKAFREFLNESGAESDEYTRFEEPELANWLSKFWFGARTSNENNPEMYCVNTMRSFKYGLNRILKKEHSFDITKSPSFSKCMEDFNLACKELKKVGKGVVKNYDEIEEEDRVLLYNSQYLNPDGDRVSLQNKVLYDILWYFCRRGQENLEIMKINWFEIKYDPKSDLQYVEQVVDKETKNHKETDKPLNTNYMMENKTDPMCPVRSFKMYISHLHPDNEYFWQTPNLKPRNPGSNVWYTKGHLGKNPLSTFVSDLCKKVGTSKIYTNHCVRVSSANVVTDSGLFNDAEVMDFTHHKAASSLQRYRRVKKAKKMEMSNVINNSIGKKNENPLPTVTSKDVKIEEKSVEPLENFHQQQNQLVPYEPNWNEDVPDFDLIDILTQIENENLQPPKNQAITTVSQQRVQQRNSPMFAGCKIENITINIVKKD